MSSPTKKKPINPAKSEPLGRLLRYFQGRPKLGATPLMASRACHNTRVTSDLSALREWGHKFRKVYQGQSKSGGLVYRYWLLS